MKIIDDEYKYQILIDNKIISFKWSEKVYNLTSIKFIFIECESTRYA